MAKDLTPEDLGLDETQEVSLDSEDLLNEEGELNEEAIAADEAPLASSKVELDIDDAPFLQEEPEEAPAPPPTQEQEAPVELKKSEDTKLSRLQKILLLVKTKLITKFKNKKVLGGSIGGLVLIIALLIFLLSGGEEKPAPAEAEPPVTTEPQEQGHGTAEPEVPAIPAEQIISWEPFWVEQTDSEGQVRLLICQFSAPTNDPALKQEAELKTLAIRDAIYYYLAHKPLTFLSDQRYAEILKEDILGIINGYLTRGQLNQLLIEAYLIK